MIRNKFGDVSESPYPPFSIIGGDPDSPYYECQKIQNGPICLSLECGRQHNKRVEDCYRSKGFFDPLPFGIWNENEQIDMTVRQIDRNIEIDPVNGSTTPTPETGQGSTIPFTPFTNKILKTPESTTIIQTPNVESFNLDPKLIFLGLGIILLLGLTK